jgi:hypothetical protein
MDHLTGATWYTTAAVADHYVGFDEAQMICEEYNARLPHLSEVLAVIAQQSSDVFCPDFDADSQFQSSFEMVPGWYWTDTPPSGHPLDQQAVCWANGSVCDIYSTCLGCPAPPVGESYTICISP